MADNNFIDYVKIHCQSGNGGAGSIHFHRDRITQMGGPDGGNGGKGGSVIVVGNSQLWTLLHLKYRKHIMAENGVGGMGVNKTGSDGKNQIIEVPIGTVARDAETNEVLFEIEEHGERKILMQGGRGGMGNAYFKTAVKQTPKFAQPGEDGQEGWKILELKLIADIGLVGFPNAGKSTLLSVISAAKPEIANYPFTTLVPNLGIVSYYDNKSFIMADIPGIIEGAAEGKGLGLRFLRHIERNSALLFMIPADADNLQIEFDILLNELNNYNPELMHKKRIIAISKCDMLDDELLLEMKKEAPVDKLADASFSPVIFISSHTMKGIKELKDLIWKELNA